MKTVFLILTYILMVSSHKDNYVFKFENPGQASTLICPHKDEVIYNISITSRPNKAKCYGRQYTVLIDSLNCYWKRQCNVTLRDSEAITHTEGEPDSSCMGRQPDVLLYNISCIHKDHVVDGIHNLTTAKAVYIEEGIIKSHEGYPWHYLANHNDLKGSAVLHRPENRKVLYMQYINLDIAESDSVTIDDNGENWNNGLQTIPNNKVKITFNVERGNKFSGFIICFKWMKGVVTDTELKQFNNICTAKSSMQATSGKESTGWIIGPTIITIKRPRGKKIRKGPDGKCKKIRYLRVGMLHLAANRSVIIKYKAGKLKQTKEFHAPLYSLHIPRKTLKRVKKMEISLKHNSILCFKWEAVYSNNPLDCGDLLDTWEECPKKATGPRKKNRKSNTKRRKGRKRRNKIIKD